MPPGGQERYSVPMTDDQLDAGRRLSEFVEIIAVLRSPGGCPWDREQTPLTMRDDLLEECYEAVDAIDENDPPHVREELGDVLLLVTMLSQMYSETGDFTMADVISEISAKMIRRHPHVFGDDKAHDAEEVLKNWEKIKTDIEGRKKGESAIDGIPGSFPPLERSLKVQKRAAKKGFDWPDISGPREKILEEMKEIDEAAASGSSTELEEEIGDLLFSVVNYSRHLGIDPSLALRRTNTKFEERFRYVERRMREDRVEMAPEALETMDDYWDEAKEKTGR